MLIRKNNEVRGLALRLDMNPCAPEVILIGAGPRIKASAERFLAAGAAVPAYVKLGTNAWEFHGNYKAVGICRDAEVIKKCIANRPFKLQGPGYPVSGVLFLEKQGISCVEGDAVPRNCKELQAGVCCEQH